MKSGASFKERLDRLEIAIQDLAKSRGGAPNEYIRGSGEPQLTDDELDELGATPIQLAHVEIVRQMDASVPRCDHN